MCSNSSINLHLNKHIYMYHFVFPGNGTDRLLLSLIWQICPLDIMSKYIPGSLQYNIVQMTAWPFRCKNSLDFKFFRYYSLGSLSPLLPLGRCVSKFQFSWEMCKICHLIGLVCRGILFKKGHTKIRMKWIKFKMRNIKFMVKVISPPLKWKWEIILCITGKWVKRATAIACVKCKFIPCIITHRQFYFNSFYFDTNGFTVE